jgi:type I restriction enzyme S subunit
VSGNAQEQLHNLETGSALKQLPVGRLILLSLAFPSPSEQRAIAEAISDVDELLRDLDRLITKKRELKEAAMQQLLTGQTRLPGFRGEWEVKRLGSVAEILMGQSPDSRNYNRRGDGVPLVQGNADIENRRSIARVWTTQLTKEGRAGDLLLTVRAPVGSVGVISERCCLGRGVCSLRPRGSAAFLFQALLYAEVAWRVLEQGSTFTSANSTQVATFSLLMPPRMEEQTAIAEILTDMDAELAALEQRREKTRDLKRAMMQELLTGKTRLI